ncbi:MAG: tRNA (adenosine(37)-N6)-threonylcarbamoyltransferase complex ATPase subunit type 1 TsaE [Bacteriovoracaceae bacterium]|jgi:tRNA threonylcarbamoyladenosine biosynthesis protein TsaE|nr:tRNA (adenosine(37)-N6)-threonylcarbamoyltransferase complex ATPase subunit type 1 TsaE [Bacteriovoracaceae bacterium]
MKVVKEWKKVLEEDLSCICTELKEQIDNPSVIILEGQMGMGKTTFAKVFINSKDTMSPSYSIINEIGDVVHADFYRLENEEEIVHLELDLQLSGKKYFLVEWGNRFVKQIERQISSDMSFYQLEIEPSSKDNIRNFTLKKYTDL